MKLERWALIAEIISGVAVVITLVFLILGLRENTNTQRASAYTELMESLNGFQTETMTNPDSVRVCGPFIDGEAAGFEGDDRTRLNLAILTIFRVYESAYYSEQTGLSVVRNKTGLNGLFACSLSGFAQPMPSPCFRTP